MFRFIRETFDTVRALLAMARDFFVRWFLPLHSDDEPDAEAEEAAGHLGWNWGDNEDASNETRLLDQVEEPVRDVEAPRPRGDSPRDPEAVESSPFGGESWTDPGNTTASGEGN
jgi:hypothetical protein